MDLRFADVDLGMQVAAWGFLLAAGGQLHMVFFLSQTDYRWRPV